MEVSNMANMELNKNMISDNDLEQVSGGIDQATQQKLAEKIKNNGVFIPMAPKSTPGKNDKLFAYKDNPGNIAYKDQSGNNTGRGLSS